MRELERDLPSRPPAGAPRAPGRRLAVVGRGRLGRALADALRRAGYPVEGPLGRGADGAGAEAVLLCVPDGEIAAAAAAVPAGRLVGHEAFSLHPLMTVTERGAEFSGAGAAVAGSSRRALALAAELARALGMCPVELAEADRVAYHAAASMASNFLITLEAAAERLAATAGLERQLLVPLVRASVENWARLGPRRALTGPVARGDEATVAAQRRAVRERAPELGGLFDALVEATRSLAAAEAQPA